MKHTREEIKGRMRDLFTQQELETIVRMMENDQIEHVGAAVDVTDPEHEYWLDQYMRLYAPTKFPEEDSVVRQEMLEFYRGGGDVDSKVSETFWQERLDLENAKKELPPLKKALEDAGLATKAVEVAKEFGEKTVAVEEEVKPKKRGRKPKKEVETPVVVEEPAPEPAIS